MVKEHQSEIHASMIYLLPGIRKYLYNALNKPGPFSDEDWIPGADTINALESSKIL